ncbi:hypothetical protein HYFRA_00008347 [Hymenoscyphus fraxineus]|uniref:Cytochrome P450 n=1 Tax=Hymenoscyphus fraxineus TaxID=746836 RepID=A0A9N9KR99_9HELO|nr:hypothetical protein HYFRA_00008347 [Hymenoscyphus fraxineus]
MFIDNINGGIGPLCVVFGIAILTYPVCCIVYNLFFHPLRHVTGPKIRAASRLPYIKTLLEGWMVQDSKRLHEKYGPVVRVAPDEVSLAYAEAWGDVFQATNGKPPFEKDRLWWQPPKGGTDDIVTAPNTAMHSRMRKVLHHSFTPRALVAQEPILQQYVQLLVQKLREQIPTGEDSTVLDIVPWLNYVTFDIIGDLSYGESFNCLESQKLHSWIKLIFENVRGFCLFTSARFYPSIEFALMKCIPSWVHDTQKDHYRFVTEKVNRRMNWEVQRPDLMSQVMRHNDKDGMSAEEIHANFNKLMIAGSETSGTLLSGVVNLLITNQEVLQKLVKELRERFPDESGMTLEQLSSLSYLNAVLSEGMRLCPPVPIMLPRRAPKEGAYVGGLWIPGGTSVGVQAWTIYRDPAHFHNSESFMPERWLPEAEISTSPFFADKRNAVQPFGVGPRSCIGKLLAWGEMRLILAKLVWAFDLEAEGEILKWEGQRTFILVEKKPVNIRIRVRN